MDEIFYNNCQIENVRVDIEPDGVYLAIEATHETADGIYNIYIPRVFLMRSDNFSIRASLLSVSTVELFTSSLPIHGEYQITKIKDKIVKK